MYAGALLQPGCCEFAATGNEACLWLLMPADFLCNMLTLSVHHVHRCCSKFHLYNFYEASHVHIVCAPCAQPSCQSSCEQYNSHEAKGCPQQQLCQSSLY